jgi:hypothetical protein
VVKVMKNIIELKEVRLWQKRKIRDLKEPE